MPMNVLLIVTFDQIYQLKLQVSLPSAAFS